MQITLNGPACAGKGTIARALAQATGIHYIDLGLVFRLSAYALYTGTCTNITDVQLLFSSQRIQYVWDGRQAAILLDGQDVTAALYAPEIAQATAQLSSVPANLQVLTQLANTLLEGRRDVICDGRSAGTIILPYADFKFYITADEQVRATRRYADLLQQNFHPSHEQVLYDIRERDRLDSQRAYDPLAVPEGAYTIDTGCLTVEESVQTIRRIIGR